VQEFIATLIGFFLLDPLQSELAEKLRGRAPREVISQVTTCARESLPAIISKASGDPWWAATSVLRVWIGTDRPERILLEAAPRCAEIIAEVRSAEQVAI
jgi:hypothetical protein